MFGLPNEFVPVLLASVFAVLLGAYMRRVMLASSHHKSTISSAHAARELGLELDPHVDLNVTLDGIELFRDTKRSSRKFNFCYVGRADLMRVRILEFQQNQETPSIPLITIPIITTVIAFESEKIGLPTFVAKPNMFRGIGIPKLFKFGIKVDIDDEFRRDYSVTTEDRRETDLRRLFNPEVRELLHDHRMVVESSRNRLIFYYPYGKITPINC